MAFKVACVQLSSKNDMKSNIERSLIFMAEAYERGADIIMLPENIAMMASNAAELFDNTYPQDEHPALYAFSQFARNHKTIVLIGSLAIKPHGSEKLANRSFLIGKNGNIIAQYDKIHLYDVSVEGGETHKESDRFIFGNNAVIAPTEFARIGMTICYDLRFAYLYRHLAQNGAEIITVPSSFTQFTGQAHWHILLRARAIETGCYIAAPAQTGTHPAGRKTFGHSLIVDPWGEVIMDLGEQEGVGIAEIDIEKIYKTRKQLPSIEHDRQFD